MDSVNPSFESVCDRFPVSRETHERLCLFHDHLIKWQKHINLISPSTIPDIWERHIFDSLQLIEIFGSSGNEHIIDIGSGAGFPGIILAIAGLNVTMIESDQRKCVFLKEALRITHTHATILNKRAEEVRGISADIITSRAVAAIVEMLDWSKNISDAHTRFCFQKGENYLKEIEEAKNKKYHFDYKTHPSKTSKTGIIIIIQNVNGGVEHAVRPTT